MNKSLPYVICTLAAAFYLYEFILQVAPAVMTQELMRDLMLNAAGLGTISAFYYYAYTPMQLPAGLLYDRYGPRVLLTIAILICAVGALCFGWAKGFMGAATGRFLMGIGSAFSFIGALVLVSRWFPPRYFALLAGLVQFMSSVGAIAGEAPLAKAISVAGWRDSVVALGFIGLALAAAVWWIVRDRPAKSVHTSSEDAPKVAPLKESLKQVCGKSQTWIVGIYAFMVWAPITAFAALWGIPYLSAVYGISAAKASAACSLIWLGIGLGSPVSGWISDYIGRRVRPLFWAAVLGAGSLAAILYIPNISFTGMCILLFLFGLAAAGQSLSFALIIDNNRSEFVGTGIGFNNMAVVAGGALFQPLLGYLLQWSWDGKILDGVPVYTVQDYRIALFVLPLCYVIAALVAMKWMRETYCQPQHVLK